MSTLRTIPAILVGTVCVVAGTIGTANASDLDSTTTRAASASTLHDIEKNPTPPERPAPAAPAATRYLLNNTYVGVWQDDGVKGQVVNYTKQQIRVRDTVMDKSVYLNPGDKAIFYSDANLSKYGDVSEGDGTWLEISPTSNPYNHSEFRLSDPTWGRPDTVFVGPQRHVQNVREGWSVGASHHDIAHGHKYWVKRESDSWEGKHGTWNTSDWAAFTIHVEEI